MACDLGKGTEAARSRRLPPSGVLKIPPRRGHNWDNFCPICHFEARWAAALIEATLVRLRVELQAAGKGRLFEAVQGFLLSGEDASYQQVADGLGLSLGAIKTAIHRMRSRYRALLREEVARTVATPAEVEDELRCLRAALRG